MSVPFNPLTESLAVPSLKEYLWRRYDPINVEGAAVEGLADGTGMGATVGCEGIVVG
jgi:hypothetical protein